jgi:hypothetical protein
MSEWAKEMRSRGRRQASSGYEGILSPATPSANEEKKGF